MGLKGQAPTAWSAFPPRPNIFREAPSKQSPQLHSTSPSTQNHTFSSHEIDQEPVKMADHGSSTLKENVQPAAESKGKGKAAEPAEDTGMDIDDSSEDDEVDEVSSKFHSLINGQFN